MCTKRPECMICGQSSAINKPYGYCMSNNDELIVDVPLTLDPTDLLRQMVSDLTVFHCPMEVWVLPCFRLHLCGHLCSLTHI